MIFEFIGTFLIRSVGYFVQGALFFEKLYMYKVFENKAQRCSTPLKKNDKVSMFYMYVIPGFNITNYESYSNFVVYFQSTLFTDPPFLLTNLNDPTLSLKFEISFTPLFLEGGLHTVSRVRNH